MANNGRGINASQSNLAGSGIGRYTLFYIAVMVDQIFRPNMIVNYVLWVTFIYYALCQPVHRVIRDHEEVALQVNLH